MTEEEKPYYETATAEQEQLALVKAMVVLVKNKIPTDIQELLLFGNPTMGVKPGVLAEAIKAARE